MARTITYAFSCAKCQAQMSGETTNAEAVEDLREQFETAHKGHEASIDVDVKR